MTREDLPAKHQPSSGHLASGLSGSSSSRRTVATFHHFICINIIIHYVRQRTFSNGWPQPQTQPPVGHIYAINKFIIINFQSHSFPVCWHAISNSSNPTAVMPSAIFINNKIWFISIYCHHVGVCDGVTRGWQVADVREGWSNEIHLYINRLCIYSLGTRSIPAKSHAFRQLWLYLHLLWHILSL